MSEETFEFLDYLNKHGLYYKINIIEEFLLSIKIDNILLFNGISGIGKTKLAEYYCKYYIEKNQLNKTIKSSFKIVKTKTSKGFAVKRNNVTQIIPKIDYEDECNFIVNNILVKGHLNITPRLFFKPKDNPEFYEYLDIATEEGYEKLDYEIILNESEYSNYIILNANNIDKNNEDILDIINRAYNNRRVKYFIIFDKINDDNLSKLYFTNDEMPPNLFIFYTGIIQKTSEYCNDLSIVNFTPISPIDYLQNNTINIKLSNTDYLEDFEKENMSNINEIKKELQKIEINHNKSLYTLLLDQLNNLYYILEEENIFLTNQIINKILNYMINAWKYENKPEIFENWKKYFDFQITQRIIPLLEINEDISIDTVNNLINYCDNEFNYYRSYTILKNMIL